MSDELNAGHRVITVTATSRPKRIAFLVDAGTIASDELDALVQHNIKHWGGGYWPIISTDGDRLEGDWWRLLEATDPDVVHSFVHLSDQLVDRIQRIIAPAQLVELTPEERGRRGGGFWIGGSALGALGVDEIARHVVSDRFRLTDSRFLYLTDSPEGGAARAFVIRNFGLISDTVSTRRAFEAVPHEVLRVNQLTEGELLDSFIQFHGQTLVPRDLSYLYAPRSYTLQHDRFAQGFHLVVGDTVADLLYAWNRPLTSERWTGRDVLWLPVALARDEAVLTLVGRWIPRVFWQQHPEGYVVSYSVDPDLLEEVARRVREAAHMPIRGQRMEPDRFPLPEPRSGLHYATLGETAPRRTEQIALTRNQGLLGFGRPPFVSRMLSNDGWMVDLDIEYNLDEPRYTNQSDAWRVPKRAVLGHEFTTNRGLARVVAGGFPSVEAAVSDQAIGIKVPSALSILYKLLEPQPTRAEDQEHKAGRFTHLETSEQGLRLWGMLQLFGSVHAAGRTFEDPYWRDVFLQLAGRPYSEVDDQIARAERLLNEAYRAVGAAGPGAAALSPDHRAVARRIVKRLFEPPPPVPILSHRQLHNNLMKHISQQRETSDPGVAQEIAEMQLGDFLDSGVLLQGVSLRCPQCGTQEWYVADDIASEMRCAGCLSSFPLPANPAWSVRLNGLVRNAVAREGVLPLLQALYDVGHMARHLFLVIPCQDLYERYGGDRFTDLDMIVIRDGQFVLGEVKSTTTGFDAEVLNKLQTVAQELRPNLVIVAAPGVEWPPEVEALVNDLRMQVEPLGTKVEARLLKW